MSALLDRPSLPARPAARRHLAKAGAMLALSGLLACASTSTPRPPGSLAGTATYRERMTLPDAARLEVQLVDITDENAAAPLVAERLIDAPGQVPIAFSLSYDPHAIDANRSYALRLRIRVGDDIWFASPFELRVLTGGAPTRQVEVLLDRVSASGRPRYSARPPADPDPPGLDARVKAVRDEARAIDARLDRFDMREVVDGSERLQLWTRDELPVKLVVAPANTVGETAPAASYYFRDGELFWVRATSAGYVFANGVLVLRTDGQLTPVGGAATSEEQQQDRRVRDDARSRLASFGVE